MKIAELKNYLKEKLKDLEINYNDNQEVSVTSSTYFCQSDEILEINNGIERGFVDLQNPIVETSDDEEE